MRQNNERYRSEREKYAQSNRRNNRGFGNGHTTGQNTRNASPSPSNAPSNNQSSDNSQTSSKTPLYSQTIGERGPVLLQDNLLHETLESFVHSTTLPRVIYTKGYGAFGHFETLNSMEEYTTAGFLQETGCQIPVSVRFSLAFGQQGAPDTLSNLRGFDTKFYTADGNFDLLTTHIPVFFVRDAIHVPDIVRLLSLSSANNLADPELFWSLFASYPEATHMLIWLLSDTGMVKSFRRIRGYSVNTFVWKNTAGIRRYVRYHWIPTAGEQYIESKEAIRLAGENPDIAGRDLYDTIAQGTPVEFELHVQLIDPEDELLLSFDPLDATKLWDEVQYPLLCVGRMSLYTNPVNYREQVEKLAFDPTNLISGIELSDDKLLQGSSFIYSDAQRYRLGPDYRNFPINRTQNCSFNTIVSSGNGRHLSGEIMRTAISKQDDFTQAGERYRTLSSKQQNHLVENIVSSLANASEKTRLAVIAHLECASSELGASVQEQTRICSR